jgi:hypothetical protein
MREPEEFQPNVEAEARRLLTAAFETAPVRPGLAAAQAAAAGPAGPSSDVVGLVRRRAARQRRARVLVPAGAVALAAALTGGVTASIVTGAGSAAAPSAREVLTAALVKTSAQSFRFNVTSITRMTEVNGSLFTSKPAYITGEFDPVSGNGEEAIHLPYGGDGSIRYIGKSEYAGGSFLTAGHKPLEVHKQWVKMLTPPPPSTSGPDPQVVGALNTDEPLNPADLLALLKSLGQVTRQGPVSGNGWTGTKYGFTETVDPRFARVLPLVGGTVSVDSSGRVRELVTMSPLEGKIKVGSKTFTDYTSYDMTFGGFGIPVTVTAPPASQVYDAGNVYWTNIFGSGY